MPVPAPATAELIKGYPTQPGPASRELLTPTAAAILTTLAAEFGPPPPMITRATGYGAGTYESNDFPNTLRLTIGDHLQKNQTDTDTVTVLQTNIDDQSGEILADVQEKLFAAGALDVYTNGIYMKKNRPAVMLSVICAPTDIEKIEQIIFSSGITFGIRKQTCRRTKLVRQIETVQTRFGPIRVKTGTYKGTLVAAKPEFTDCQTAAATHNVPVKTVIAEAFNTFSNRTER